MSLRSLTLAALAAALLLPAAAHAAAKAAPAAALPQKPVLVPVADDPTVSFKIAFRLGAQDDPKGKEGLAYLTAQLMADGATKRHSYPEILEALYPMATGYSVRVDKELVTFSGRVHRDHLAAFTDLLVQAIREPAFDEADFARVRQRTLDYITKSLRYASDEDLGKNALYGAVFEGTPYAHLNVGTVEGLKAITLEDVRAFHASRFTRERVLIGVGGGYDAALVTKLEREFAQLPSGPAATTPAPAVKPLKGRSVLLVKKPGAATAISFGHPIALKRGTREFYAMWLANSWLGEHRNSSSHLYQVIREARGMNYGDYSYIEHFPEGGQRTVPPPNVPRRAQLFEVWIRPVPNAQAHFALRAAMREVERLVRDGLTQDQVDLTRSYLTKYSLNYAPATDDRLGYAIDDRVYGTAAPGHLEDFRRILPTLTRDEVNAAIRRNLHPADLVIAMVSEQADSLAAALPADTPSPITYATPKPDEVMQEDRIIQAFPLGLAKDRIRVVPVEELFQR